MFDTLQPPSIVDRLSDAIYRWRGIEDWPEAEGVVFLCRWTPDAEIPGHCNYQVSFYYLAEETLQVARVGINGVDAKPPFQVGDSFTLRFNPRRSSTYHCYGVPSQVERFGLIALLALLGLAGAFLVVKMIPL